MEDLCDCFRSNEPHAIALECTNKSLGKTKINSLSTMDIERLRLKTQILYHAVYLFGSCPSNSTKTETRELAISFSKDLKIQFSTFFLLYWHYSLSLLPTRIECSSCEYQEYIIANIHNPAAASSSSGSRVVSLISKKPLSTSLQRGRNSS
jgi:hypothetical protein